MSIGPCVMYTGKARRGSKNEYGVVRRQGRRRLAHQAAYEEIHGEIPAGHELHHVCGETLCVNPEHLVLTTPEEHRARYHRRRTHCPHGHEISGENAYYYKDRAPDCRICRRRRLSCR